MERYVIRVRYRRLAMVMLLVLLPLLLVACSGGSRLSLQELVDAAEPGETIVVPSGTYKENLSIDKSLILEADGEVKVIGVTKAVPAIAVSGDAGIEVAIRGLSVSSSRGSGIKVAGEASLELSNATISRSESGALIARDAAQVALHDCTMRKSPRNGITLTGEASLEARNCQMLSNAAAGFAAVTTGTVRIIGGSVEQNGEYGLNIGGESDIELQDVDIHDNGRGQSTATEFVSLGTVFGSPIGTGIWLRDKATLRLEHCDVSQSEGYGIIAFDDTSVRLYASNVLENGGSGVVLLSSRAHELLDSRIEANGAQGVVVAGAGNLLLDRCTITRNKVGLAVFSIKCYGTESVDHPLRFTGRLQGHDNLIPSPEEPEGNLTAGCCPESTRSLLETPSSDAADFDT